MTISKKLKLFYFDSFSCISLVFKFHLSLFLYERRVLLVSLDLLEELDPPAPL